MPGDSGAQTRASTSLGASWGGCDQAPRTEPLEPLSPSSAAASLRSRRLQDWLGLRPVSTSEWLPVLVLFGLWTRCSHLCPHVHMVFSLCARLSVRMPRFALVRTRSHWVWGPSNSTIGRDSSQVRSMHRCRGFSSFQGPQLNLG